MTLKLSTTTNPGVAVWVPDTGAANKVLTVQYDADEPQNLNAYPPLYNAPIQLDTITQNIILFDWNGLVSVTCPMVLPPATAANVGKTISVRTQAPDVVPAFEYGFIELFANPLDGTLIGPSDTPVASIGPFTFSEALVVLGCEDRTPLSGGPPVFKWTVIDWPNIDEPR